MRRSAIGSYSSKNLQEKQYAEISRTMKTQKGEEIGKKTKYSSQQPYQSLEKAGRSSQLQVFQERYRQLQQKYRDLLQIVQYKNIEHQRLKADLFRARQQHQKDKQQIQHLRCIIGLVNKKSMGVQAQTEAVDSSNIAGSRLNKFDQSTQDQIKFKYSSDKFNSREPSPIRDLYVPSQRTSVNKNSSNKDFSENRQSRVKQKNDISSKIQWSNFQKEGKNGAKLSKKAGCAGYSRFRYVPGIDFK